MSKKKKVTAEDVVAWLKQQDTTTQYHVARFAQGLCQMVGAEQSLLDEDEPF